MAEFNDLEQREIRTIYRNMRGAVPGEPEYGTKSKFGAWVRAGGLLSVKKPLRLKTLVQKNVREGIEEAIRTGGDARALATTIRGASAETVNEMSAAVRSIGTFVGSIFSGNTLSRSMSDLEQTWWQNTNQLHPDTEDALKVIRGRWRNQQIRGDFYGGWKGADTIGG